MRHPRRPIRSLTRATRKHSQNHRDHAVRPRETVSGSMRAGIIGMCGWAGTRHLAAYRQLGIPVTHFVDAAPEAETLGRRFGVERVTSIEALARTQVDIVSVALPPSMQPPVCRTL